MSKIRPYKPTASTIRNANKNMKYRIKNSISSGNYNGDIVLRHRSPLGGIVTKIFTNSEVKQAYNSARKAYAERI